LTSTAIVTVGWRFKDRAKELARQGAISWAQFRAYCDEVDRIKRARLNAARPGIRLVAAQPDPLTATAAMMRSRHTGNTNDTRLDRPRTSNAEAKRAELATSLLLAPELSDREHGRRCGADHKTVAAARRRLQESGEIPHFLRRVDPRTGKQSQPATQRPRASRFFMAVAE
jgi:hypothetical protein